jgi:hypothetical protein
LRRADDSVEKPSGALIDVQVDLNPHQIDAALLADEVGLGKTIGAGLVITPANLRKQWFQELTQKFFLPCRIIEAKSYNAHRHGGVRQSFRPGAEAPFSVGEGPVPSHGPQGRNRAQPCLLWSCGPREGTGPSPTEKRDGHPRHGTALTLPYEHEMLVGGHGDYSRMSQGERSLERPRLGRVDQRERHGFGVGQGPRSVAERRTTLRRELVDWPPPPVVF